MTTTPTRRVATIALSILDELHELAKRRHDLDERFAERLENLVALLAACPDLDAAQRHVQRAANATALHFDEHGPTSRAAENRIAPNLAAAIDDVVAYLTEPLR